MKIGIIGLGSMGYALLQAILFSTQIEPEDNPKEKSPENPAENSQPASSSKSYQLDNIAASVHSPKSQANADKLKVRTFSNNSDLVEFADLVIIAVKPKDIKSVLEPLRDALKGKAILSVAAGFSYDDFKHLLDASTRVMVSLPNLALSVGAGVIGIGEETTFDKREQEFIGQVFASSAKLIYLPSKLLGTLSSLSGSGPAFLALVAESMVEAGVKQGLERGAAAEIVSATFTGTGLLLENTFDSPDALKTAVCSPGGTSIVGVSSLLQSGMPEAFVEAIDKTSARFYELASSLS